MNYRIHTEAIKENLLPPELTIFRISMTYASETDVLNVALFGKTAKEWREESVDFKGNMRDNANLDQLLVLANMESYNAILIEQGKSQTERFRFLNRLAIQQLKALQGIRTREIKKLGNT